MWETEAFVGLSEKLSNATRGDKVPDNYSFEWDGNHALLRDDAQGHATKTNMEVINPPRGE